MINKPAVYKAQRDWRRDVIRRLKLLKGNYCNVCETPDVLQLQQSPRFLELVIPDRRDSSLASYGNNTVTIYNQILKGKIPPERVLLLCEHCKYEMRLKTDVRHDETNPQ